MYMYISLLLTLSFLQRKGKQSKVSTRVSIVCSIRIYSTLCTDSE